MEEETSYYANIMLYLWRKFLVPWDFKLKGSQIKNSSSCFFWKASPIKVDWSSLDARQTSGFIKYKATLEGYLLF